MARRGGLRTATTATAVAVALIGAAACGAERTSGESPRSSAAPAAPALQLRIVTSADPLGARTCPGGDPAPTAPAELCDREGATLYRLAPSVTHEPVRAARVDQSSGRWLVNIQLGDADAGAVGEATGRNVGKQFALVVGARVVSAPTIASPVTQGSLQVAGAFTEQQARDLAHALKPS